jgi:primosomal protein N'
MHIITVYPLAKGVRTPELQYYYSESINRGTVVSVPFGNRDVQAVVAESSTAEDKKLAIRSADYELKPVKLAHKQIFFAQFLSACEQFASFSGVTTGATIRALTPATIRNNLSDIPDVNSDFLQPNISAPPAKVIQDTANRQIEHIHSLTLSRLESGRSVFICCPTISGCDRLSEKLDIDATVQLHSSLTNKQLVKNWTSLITEKSPTLIIATPTFLSIPRSDLGQIILTAESNEAYKMNHRPFLDKSQFSRHLANTYRQPYLMTDRALTVESLWELENKQLTAQHDPVFQYHKSIDTSLIDMTELPDTDDSGVRVFSPELAKLLRKTTNDGEQVLLFVARSGRRPFTACRDCGETLKCPQCDLPLLLIDEEDKRKFACRTCKKEFSAERRCDNCDSWHLQPLGIGVDFVVEILQKQLDAPVYQIDGNSTQSTNSVKAKLESFTSESGGILVTTSLGIDHLDESIAASGVVTADSLLAIPDLSISHKLFSLLLAMRELTEHEMIIQTRSNQKRVFTHALTGDVDGFYNDQITERKQFQYPPFSYLIKLHINEPKKRAQQLLQNTKQKLTDYDLQIYPDRSSAGINVLIRIDRSEWVDQELVEKLRSLPLAVSINAHPKSLL